MSNKWRAALSLAIVGVLAALVAWKVWPAFRGPKPAFALAEVTGTSPGESPAGEPQGSEKRLPTASGENQPDGGVQTGGARDPVTQDPREQEPDEPVAAPPASPEQPAEDAPADDEPTEEGPKQADEDAPPFQHRVKAPPLDGGVAWINTAGPLEISDLRGKFVLLDFWTYCCINCMHILPELKKLEAAYPNELVVIGVHSAKFETEKESNNITEAVLRYEILHPVVNDRNHAIWNNYQVQSWPSLRVIDPEGYLVAGHSGEIGFEDLDHFLKAVLPYYRKKGLIDSTPLHFDLAKTHATATPLRFPGKVLADEAGDRLFIADSNHNRLVITRLDGTLLSVIGNGAIGAADGGYAEATFNHPQGMALVDKTLYVADTENHLIRAVDIEGQRVRTIAGTGSQGRNPWPGLDMFGGGIASLPELPKTWEAKPLETGLNSPWDVLVHDKDLYIAMAGPHQIWKMPLDESTIGPYAGNGREDIVDGPLLPDRPFAEGAASFAQPSGLATDGKRLFVADSEGSSIRAVPFDADGMVETVIGTAYLPIGRLFHSGDRDGTGPDVLLQHALGVAFHEGSLYVADTYNNKIKRIDPEAMSATTISGDGVPGTADDPPQFDEPAGISFARGKLFVADTNNHAIRTIDLENGNRVATLEIPGLTPPELPEPAGASPFADATEASVEPVTVRPVDGHIRLVVSLTLPAGWKMNKQAPMRYQLESSTPDGPLDRQALDAVTRVDEPAETFEIRIPVAKDSGDEALSLVLNYFYCQEGAEGLCKMGTVRWTAPVKITQDGQEAARLGFAVE